CHICTDRSGRMAIVANWQTGSAAAFPIGRHGELGESTAFSQHEGPRSGTPAPGPPQIHCHSVVVTPDNRFLLATDTGLNRIYVSNRRHNSIAVFRVDSRDGTLTLVETFMPGGETPRSFAIDPTGSFLIEMMQRSGTIIPLRIDPESGRLAMAGGNLNLPFPVCAEFVPAT